jgi:hypothetical protein
MEDQIMTYRLEGRLLEVCSCKAICPCWVGQDPDGGQCDGTLAWHMDSGQVNGVDVSGRTIAAVVHIPGNVLKGNWRAAMYVDDGATDAQMDALTQVYTGKLGGPVAQLAGLIGEVVSLERAPISFDVRSGKGTLRIGAVVDAQVEPFLGAHGEPTELAHSIFSTIPGSPVYVGASPNYRLNQPKLGIDLTLQGHSSAQGSFRFDG